MYNFQTTTLNESGALPLPEGDGESVRGEYKVTRKELERRWQYETRQDIGSVTSDWMSSLTD